MEKEFLIPFIKAAIPEFDWILSDMEENGGWLNLNENLIQTFIQLKLEWWKAYDDEKLFNVYRALMVLDLDDLKAIKTKEQAEELNKDIISELSEFIQSEEYLELSTIKPLSDDEKEKLKKETEKMLSDMSEQERIEYWRDISFYWLGFFCTFFDLLSLMIHGKSLRQLVNEAKQGDDKSFILAAQTDRMVLYLPYFQERLKRAQLGNDGVFLRELSYRIKNPLVRGKIKRRTLWLLFALLESEGQLDMPLSELLVLCEETGVYGDQFGIGDENSLGKRRREYISNQGTGKIF